MRKSVFASMLVSLLSLSLMPVVFAVQFTDTMTAADQQAIDLALTPVMKIYAAAKYVASVLAGLLLVFVGIAFILSGSDQQKRESAKARATFIVVGLAVIWAVPYLINFVTA